MASASLPISDRLSPGQLARVLSDVAVVLVGKDDLPTRLAAAWQEVRRVLSSDRCVLLTWPERELLSLQQVSLSESDSEELRDSLERRIRLMTDEAALRDVSLSSAPGGAETTAGEGPAIECLCLPLMGPEGVLGVLCVMREEQPFSVEDVAILAVIASQIAGCLANHRYQQALAHVNEARGRFISQVAHELRNALQPAQLSAQVIERLTASEDRLQRPAQSLVRSVGHMTRMVEDLLDTQRIVNGQIELQRSPLDLNVIATAVVENRRPQAGEKGLGILLCLPSYPLVVEGDPGRLDQVLTNLVNNAIRYSDRGELRVTLVHEAAEAVVRVSDTGIGMDAETQEEVFELFRTAPTSERHDRGGLGIGLAVVKQLTEFHGGTVSCFSPGPGKGSEFVVRFPLLRIG